MFKFTPDQDYILDVLKKTKFMRTEQAFRLLKAVDGRKNEQYAEGMLRQLKHMQKIIWHDDSNTIFSLPNQYGKPVDEEMLSAIDIMTELNDVKIVSVSSNNPLYKLSFITGQEDSLSDYAVIFVSHGSEAAVSAALNDMNPGSRTVILLLSDFGQKDSITAVVPHYFAVYDNGKYRYFEGGG